MGLVAEERVVEHGGTYPEPHDAKSEHESDVVDEGEGGLVLARVPQEPPCL